MFPEKPNFAAWRHESLVKLADECYNEIKRMQQEIEQLKADKRVAIDAYRAIIKEHHDS